MLQTSKIPRFFFKLTIPIWWAFEYLSQPLWIPGSLRDAETITHEYYPGPAPALLCVSNMNVSGSQARGTTRRQDAVNSNNLLNLRISRVRACFVRGPRVTISQTPLMISTGAVGRLGGDGLVSHGKLKSPEVARSPRVLVKYGEDIHRRRRTRQNETAAAAKLMRNTSVLRGLAVSQVHESTNTAPFL